MNPVINEINGLTYDFSELNNPSFTLTAKELKNVGIKNYYFMLRVIDPRVAFIDPFKPNITDAEIGLLMREYRLNMWWFIRTAVRLRTDKGIVPYTLHRGLCAGNWCFEHHRDYCLCESRQTYKTTESIAGPLQWAFQTSRNLHMHFYGKETDNTKRNLGYLKDDIELLPEWIQFRRFLSSDGKVKKSRASTEVLENGKLKNDLSIYPKPSSLSHAQSIGRGGSGAVIYYDEIEHTPFIGEVISNSAPLFKTASDNARDAGSPYCRVMTCTPGNLDTKEGAESYPIIKAMIPWSEKIYDMSESELEEYLSTYKEAYRNSEESHERDVMDVFYIEYQYYQIRKTYKWVQQQYALTGDKMGIRREILLQRQRGSRSSPIDPEDLEYLISNMKKPMGDIIINNKWKFNLYEHGQGMLYGKLKELDENIPYLVGIDPAGGGGGDNFAITIVNPYNLKIAAEFKSPYINGPDAVRMLVSLVEDYIPKGILIPERNSLGIYLIQFICEQTSIKNNLYWNKKLNELDDMVTDDPKDYELKRLAMQYRKFGHWTGKNRSAMFELLFLHVSQCKDILNTENLVDDICKLEKNPSTGKIAARKGEHDDCVMSYLIAIYTFYNGDNLEEFGIDEESKASLIGPIQDDFEEKMKEKDPINGYFSTEHVKTFDDVMIESAIRDEEMRKDLASRFDFIYDPVYSNPKNREDDNSTSLSSYFFETLNGF